MKRRGNRMYDDGGKWYYELPRKPIPQPPLWLSLLLSVAALIVTVLRDLLP